MERKSTVSATSIELSDFFSAVPSRADVFRAIYHSGGISRADIARLTGLTKVTVSDVASSLINLGLISESEPQRSNAPGKPPVLLSLNRDAIRAIAVDISSESFLTVGSIDLFGSVLSSNTYSISSQTDEAFLDAAYAAIEAELADSDVPVLGIGVGAAGVVNDRGEIVDGTALALHNFPLQTRIAERFGVEVRVANDANVATKADALFGGGQPSHLLVRIVQGVGAGLILENTPYLGSNFAAGELGHVVVVPGGQACKCGKLGCLESEVAAEMAGAEPDGSKIGALLGTVLAPITSVLNLSEIVVSAPAQIQSDELLEALFVQVESATLPEISQHLDVRFSKLGNDIVLLGAAALVLSAVLGVS